MLWTAKHNVKERFSFWNFVTANPSSIPVTLPSSNEESFPRVFSRTVISFPVRRSLMLCEVFSMLSSILEWYLCWNVWHKVTMFQDWIIWTKSHPIHPVSSAQFYWLIFCVKNNIDHGAYLCRQDVGCCIKKYPFVQLALKCSKCPKSIDLERHE